MKANKKTLMAVKSYLENRDGWDLDESIDEMVVETGLLKHNEIEHSLATDECGIEWDGEQICLLSQFIGQYSEIFIGKVCNMIESFVGEEIDCYLEEVE